MRSKILLINVVLALLTGLFLVKTVKVWQSERSLPTNKLAHAGASSGNGAGRDQSLSTRPKIAPKSAFKEITNKNLFSETRTEFKPLEKEKEDEVPVQSQTLTVDGRKIVLFGVILMDAHQRALISDPESKPGVGGTRWVKTGDAIGNLRVNQISKESIVFADADKQYRIDLYDQRRKQRGAVAAVQPDARPMVVVTQPQPAQPAPKEAPPAQPAAKSADDDYEMVKTPFGLVKRKK